MTPPFGARLVESPLDIRAALQEQRERSAKAWVFTSATLGDDDRLSWFSESAGLEDARIVRLGSRASSPGRTKPLTRQPSRRWRRGWRAPSAAAPSC